MGGALSSCKMIDLHARVNCLQCSHGPSAQTVFLLEGASLTHHAQSTSSVSIHIYSMQKDWLFLTSLHVLLLTIPILGTSDHTSALHYSNRA